MGHTVYLHDQFDKRTYQFRIHHSRPCCRVSDSASTSAIEQVSNSARQVLELERETLELRRELQDSRAKKEEADQKLIQ